MVNKKKFTLYFVFLKAEVNIKYNSEPISCLFFPRNWFKKLQTINTEISTQKSS